MTGEEGPVRVTIFGEEYAIRSDKGEEYTRACAKHVDDLIQEAHVRGKVAEPHKAAILAAMQLTDQLFRNRAAHQGQSRRLAERLAGLRARIEEAIAPDPAGDVSAQGTLVPPDPES
ncbi:MAG: cell division protein ZapA [Gemmatimonadota bacterium]|nr:cell division protein ZapA [Gemmatimonadota bacterium]